MNDADDIIPAETETDLDRLEAYLDDALDPPEAAAVRARLAADADLSAVLAGLRAERADRAAVWASLEPDDRAIEQLCWRVKGAVAAELRPATPAGRSWAARIDPWRLSRITSAAAACVVLGFFGGRLGRGPTPPPAVAASNPPAAMATATVGGPVDAAVDVPITDEYGRLVASQKFRTADEARQFLSDLRAGRDGDASAVAGPARSASELRY